MFKAKKWDIVFYYPQHFNRGKDNVNPYFERMISSVEKNHMSYLLLEEPDKNFKIKSGSNTEKFRLGFFFIIALRRILPLFLFSGFEKRDHIIGKLLNVFTFGRYKANIYITLSNSMGGVLRGISPDAKIFDYQHGIITSTQPGFFQGKKATDWIKLNGKEVVVYGQGFKDILLKTDKDYYHNKVHIIGVSHNFKDYYSKGKNILVSLQIIENDDVSEEWLKAQVILLENLFEDFLKNNYHRNITIFIKHHPRSTRTFNLNCLYRFPFVKEFDSSIESCSIALHITFYSTTAFEFASLGVPTLFLYNEVIPEGKTVFFDEFNYPFPNYRTILQWLEILGGEKEEEISECIKRWYSDYYQDFDEEKFVELLRKNLHD